MDGLNPGLLTVVLLLSCITGVVFTTSPVQTPCENGRYFPCVCEDEFQWSPDVESIKCDAIAMKDVVKVLQNVKNKSKNRIYLTVTNQNLTALPEKVFGDVPIQGVTLALPNLRNVDDNAFLGQENSLETLSFDGCSLSAIPTRSISPLARLTIFEYVNSKVKLGRISQSTFVGMKSAAYVEQLQLTNNGIQSIRQGALKMFTNVNYLILNDNELAFISAESLPPKKLDSIELNGNKFTQIPVNLFAKLNKNSDISLRNNRISRMTGKVLKLSLKNKIRINLYNNDLRCDCKFKMLGEYVEEHPDGNTISGKCASPEKLKDKDVFELKLTDFSNCPDSDCFIF